MLISLLRKKGKQRHSKSDKTVALSYSTNTWNKIKKKQFKQFVLKTI